MKLYKYYSLILRDPVYFNEYNHGVYPSAHDALIAAEHLGRSFFRIEPWRKWSSYNEKPSAYEMKDLDLLKKAEGISFEAFNEKWSIPQDDDFARRLIRDKKEAKV